MMNLRRASFWAALAATWSCLIPACQTGAIAIPECREIESARCRASVHCGTITDVTACERFVRDQCLHGIAGPKAPSRAAQADCVDMIRDAGACAADDTTLPIADCADLDLSDSTPISGKKAAKHVCDLIGRPWDFEGCAYLNEAAGGSGGDE